MKEGCLLGTLFSLVLLDLSHNKLKSLPDLSFLASLTKLYLSDNEITEIDRRIVVVPKLKELSLRYVRMIRCSNRTPLSFAHWEMWP